MKNIKTTACIVLALFILLSISTLVNVHVHHGPDGVVSIILNARSSCDDCAGHRDRGCPAESLLDHVSEHGLSVPSDCTDAGPAGDYQCPCIANIACETVIMHPCAVPGTAVSETNLPDPAVPLSTGLRAPPRAA